MGLTEERVREIVTEMQAANNVEFVAGLKVEMDEIKTKTKSRLRCSSAR